MLTSSGSGIIPPIDASNPIYTGSKRVSQTAPPSEAEPQYDSASFSSARDEDSAFQMALVGRLAQEVRTTTTTRDIQKLRQQVASGEYSPDPYAMAAKMMLMGNSGEDE
jgi:anti-sigma28 factor (negative regulator of flagellin synthesis)